MKWCSLLTGLLGLIGVANGFLSDVCSRGWVSEMFILPQANNVTDVDSVIRSGLLLLNNIPNVSKQKGQQRWTWALLNGATSGYQFVATDGDLTYKMAGSSAVPGSPSMVLRAWIEREANEQMELEVLRLVKTIQREKDTVEETEVVRKEQWVVKTHFLLLEFNVSYKQGRCVGLQGQAYLNGHSSPDLRLDIHLMKVIWSVELRLWHWNAKGTFTGKNFTGFVNAGDSRLIHWHWKNTSNADDQVGSQGVIKWFGRTHTYVLDYSKTPSHAFQGGVVVQPSHDYEVTEPLVKWKSVWTPGALLSNTSHQEYNLTWEVVPYPIRLAARWVRESRLNDSLTLYRLNWEAASETGDFKVWSTTKISHSSCQCLSTSKFHVVHATYGGRYGASEEGKIGDEDVVIYKLGVDLRNISTNSTTEIDDEKVVEEYYQGRQLREEELTVRHNLTSPYYSFESNMTRAYNDSEQAVVTWITQKGYSKVWEVLNVTLKQIFHVGEIEKWETCLMRSGFFDMHVRAQWQEPLSAFYDKLFQFHSHSENVWPTMNLLLRYQNQTQFYHRLGLPKVARNVEMVLDLRDGLIVTILAQNELESNSGLPIGHFQGSGKRCGAALDVKEWYEIGANLAQHFSKVGQIWKEAATQEEHPVNVLLKPVIGTTLRKFGEKILTVISKVYSELL